jgi:hypothetical protein
MARRKGWSTPPEKTVFGTASTGIKAAINTMARQVVNRFQLDPMPTEDVLTMLIRPKDREPLTRAFHLLRESRRSDNPTMMAKFASDKGEWAKHSRIRFRGVHADTGMCLVPDYCAPTVWEASLGKDFDNGNIMPEASFEQVTALGHGLKDLIEVAHDWAMVEALFNYFDRQPERYRKSNIRFLWSGIMPLLRQGGESCQSAAAALIKVSDSGWCQTPPEIYPAIKHANEVIARGLLLTGHGHTPHAEAVGYMVPQAMCGSMWHPAWSLTALQPKL